MTTSNEERILFGEIQKKLFYMIPEKWESIHLYASISEEGSKKLTGEMYFYYIPKGILQRKPINVYQIPSLFNIDEESYNQLVQKLYIDIKNLRNLQKERNEYLWTNLTITIANHQFKIEYAYEDLGRNSMFSPYERHIIWRYKNLNVNPELLTKEEKDIINRYLSSNLVQFEQENNEIYLEGVYTEQDHNIIDYERTLTLEAAIASQQEENNQAEEKKKEMENVKPPKKTKQKSKPEIMSAPPLKPTREKKEPQMQNNENQILFGRVEHMREMQSMPRRPQRPKNTGNPRKKEIEIDNDTILSSDFMRRKD